MGTMHDTYSIQRRTPMVVIAVLAALCTPRPAAAQSALTSSKDYYAAMKNYINCASVVYQATIDNVAISPTAAKLRAAKLTSIFSSNSCTVPSLGLTGVAFLGKLPLIKPVVLEAMKTLTEQMSSVNNEAMNKCIGGYVRNRYLLSMKDCTKTNLPTDEMGGLSRAPALAQSQTSAAAVVDEYFWTELKAKTAVLTCSPALQGSMLAAMNADRSLGLCSCTKSQVPRALLGVFKDLHPTFVACRDKFKNETDVVDFFARFHEASLACFDKNAGSMSASIQRASFAAAGEKLKSAVNKVALDPEGRKQFMGLVSLFFQPALAAELVDCKL